LKKNNNKQDSSLKKHPWNAAMMSAEYRSHIHTWWIRFEVNLRSMMTTAY